MENFGRVFGASPAVLDFGPRYHVQEIRDAVIVAEFRVSVVGSRLRSRNFFVAIHDQVSGAGSSPAGNTQRSRPNPDLKRPIDCKARARNHE